MFGDQTPSNIVWWPNILPFGHLVWCCLIVFDRVWSCLKNFEGHQTFDQTHFVCSRVWWAMVCSFGQAYQTCLAYACVPRLLSGLYISIVWSVFDQTCFNRLVTHLNISMFVHQAMFDDVWSPNIYRLDRPLHVRVFICANCPLFGA